MTNEQSTPDQWRSAFAESHEVWTQFSTSVAAVAVAGPASAAEAAEGPRVVMYDWEKAGIDWLAAALCEGHGRLDEHSERFHEAWRRNVPRTAHSRRLPGKLWEPVPRSCSYG
ncbi:hypothetical protein ACIP5U_28090 [Streptomyces sp. NPDC088788]|uniref:hypothetical protein n=1 Tax=Streptomyces sp. NPDC088788 TaxID=3365898 RepID=UPI003810CB13